MMPLLIYFGKQHIPYAISAIVSLTLFVIFPALLLMVYPFSWFQKLLNLFPFHWHILHTFMDAFLGCYKDGTEPGTCDCRWFGSIFFLARVIIGTFFFDASFFPIISMMLGSLALLFIIIEPFKPYASANSNISAIFILLLALFYVSSAGYAATEEDSTRWSQTFYGFAAFTTVGTILYLFVVIAIWMIRAYARNNNYSSWFLRLFAWRHGYSQLD